MPIVKLPKPKPGRPKLPGLKKQIKFTPKLLERIEQYQLYVKNKTGLNPTFNDSIRCLLDRGLNELKIYELEDDD